MSVQAQPLGIVLFLGVIVFVVFVVLAWLSARDSESDVWWFIKRDDEEEEKRDSNGGS